MILFSWFAMQSQVVIAFNLMREPRSFLDMAVKEKVTSVS